MRLQAVPAQSLFPIRLGLPIAEGLIKPAHLDDSKKERLSSLIERSFGKKLVPGYFDMPIEGVLIEADFLGAAIIKSLNGIPYLDKFAVDPEWQKMGIGRGLWNHIKNEHDSLIWRSRNGNPVNPWYNRNSDQCSAIGKWIVFSYNLGEKHQDLVPVAASLPETLMTKEVSA